METKKEIIRREIRRYEQVIDSLEEPENRITKVRKRKLLTEALVADLFDAAGGTLIPIIGDLASPFVFYEYFKWRFDSYNVKTSEFLDSGTGGKFGKITTWAFDTVIGFFPVVGDFADLVVASWFFTIYTTIKKVQEKDAKRKEQYRDKLRQSERLLQNRLQKIEQLDQQQIQSIRRGT